MPDYDVQFAKVGLIPVKPFEWNREILDKLGEIWLNVYHLDTTVKLIKLVEIGDLIVSVDYVPNSRFYRFDHNNQTLAYFSNWHRTYKSYYATSEEFRDQFVEKLLPLLYLAI